MAACPGGGLWADWSPLLGPTAAANFALVSRPCPELPQRVPGSAKGTRQGRAAGSLGEGGVRKEGGAGRRGLRAESAVGRPTFSQGMVRQPSGAPGRA